MFRETVTVMDEMGGLGVAGGRGGLGQVPEVRPREALEAGENGPVGTGEDQGGDGVKPVVGRHLEVVIQRHGEGQAVAGHDSGRVVGPVLGDADHAQPRG